MLNVLILAAHANKMLSHEEPMLPYCLTEIDGKVLLEFLTESITPLNPHQVIFAFMKQDIDYWNLDHIAAQLTPHAVVISVEKPTAGALCTALLSIHYINNDDELLILGSNEFVRQNLETVIQQYRKLHLDAGVLCFNSVHPRYAYARLNSSGFVIETAEKRPISRNALTGIFWFAQGKIFVRAAQETIRKGAMVKNAFFISSTLNELILQHSKVGVFPIKEKQYIPLKTERQLELLETKASFERL